MAKMHSYENWIVGSKVTELLHDRFGLGAYLRRLSDTNPKTVLEIGAGPGATTSIISRKYPTAQITATDFDEELVLVAKSKYPLPNVSYQQADGTKLPFPDNYFDLVFAVLTLHHIHEFATTVRELARVVKPGGAVHLIDIPTDRFTVFHPIKSRIPGIFSSSDVTKLMEDSGLIVQGREGYLMFYLEGIKLQNT